LKGLRSPEELDAMLEGFNDFMTNRAENEREIMQTYASSLNAILQGRMDAGVASMEQQRDEFLSGYFKEFPSAITTASGLVYHEIEAGTGESPTLESKVLVHYHGKFMDGKIFDSSVERGEPVSFPLNQVIQGWQEGLQLMKVGGKGQFVIPSQLAYGDKGAPPAIPPSATLVFDVKLLSIE
jgi:FKBP-type peptidyl-prolyl cis-trans isomerase FkpA